MPFLAHATMEPMNCVVHVTADGCEVWIGTQVMTRVQGEVAKALNLPPEKVTVHQHLLGGGFGRRLEADMAVISARIAQKVATPLKVTWSREEDIRHDVYRPIYRDVISAQPEGRQDQWLDLSRHRLGGARALVPAGLSRRRSTSTASMAPPTFPTASPTSGSSSSARNREVVTTGFWRGVGPNNNVFATESFIDELAHKAGKDPVDFRVSHARQDAAPESRGAARGAEIRLGREASGTGGARHLRPGGLRQLHLHRGRGRGR